MNLDDIKNNLRKFFRGEETEEGRRLIDRWYHYFDDKSNELTDYSDEEKEKLRQELWTDIKASATGPQTRRGNHHRSKGTSWPTKMAAGFIIVLLALSSVLYYQGVYLQGTGNAAPIEYKTAVNPTGQTSQIILSDGSTVWLSAASTLRYPEEFGDTLRAVSLKGEAFFDVTENPDKPFVVNSGALQTKVLGTSFNVRVFEDEADIQVTVATGRVSVEQNADSVDQKGGNDDPIAVLTPDKQLVFNKETSTGITQTVNAALYTSWKDGKLIFDNHSFEEIAQRLERWYGVDIQFMDAALKQIRFKITFENNSLEYALRMLQTIEDFKFEMEDDQVWIRLSS